MKVKKVKNGQILTANQTPERSKRSKSYLYDLTFDRAGFDPDEPGFAFTVFDRRFRLTGTQPYRTKKGEETVLLTWQGTCRKCGSPFEVRTPKFWRNSKSFGQVHCPEHTLSKSECAERWVAARKSDLVAP